MKVILLRFINFDSIIFSHNNSLRINSNQITPRQIFTNNRLTLPHTINPLFEYYIQKIKFSKSQASSLHATDSRSHRCCWARNPLATLSDLRSHLLPIISSFSKPISQNHSILKNQHFVFRFSWSSSFLSFLFFEWMKHSSIYN